MPSKPWRMWVIVDADGKPMLHTMHRERGEAAWLARGDDGLGFTFGKSETDAAWMKRTGYRAVRVRCEVEEKQA